MPASRSATRSFQGQPALMPTVRAAAENSKILETSGRQVRCRAPIGLAHHNDRLFASGRSEVRSPSWASGTLTSPGRCPGGAVNSSGWRTSSSMTGSPAASRRCSLSDSIHRGSCVRNRRNSRGRNAIIAKTEQSISQGGVADGGRSAYIVEPSISDRARQHVDGGCQPAPGDEVSASCASEGPDLAQPGFLAVTTNSIDARRCPCVL